MVQVNVAKQELNGKIVYYGPQGAGKTANIVALQGRLPAQSAVPGEVDSNRLFDYVQLDLGGCDGLRTRLHVYTVPASELAASTMRRMVLRGLDAVIFVADARASRMAENIAALLQKGLHQDATAIPARTALALATREAARALSAPHIGSLEPGKRADLITVDLEASHLSPLYPHEDAIYSHLVYSAQASDVRDTMIEGRFVMRDRRLTTLDEVALRHEAQTWVERNYG